MRGVCLFGDGDPEVGFCGGSDPGKVKVTGVGPGGRRCCGRVVAPKVGPDSEIDTELNAVVLTRNTRPSSDLLT